MTKSSTTSTTLLGHSRIGDHRLVVPFPMRALDLWTIIRMWPDANDRRVLIQFQRTVRTSPPQPERKEAKRWSADRALSVALTHLVRRHHQHQQYEARWSFAEAVQRQSILYKITEPFDFYGAYAGLVSRPLDGDEERVLLYGTGPHPMELQIILGVAGVDTRIMAGESPDDIAKEVCRELIDAFSVGEYTPEDMKLIAMGDNYVPQ